MRGNYLILRLKLDTIRNFLDHVIEETWTEIESVERRNEAGEFEEIDDYENALYFPIMRQEIAARAVYYEITALVENELHASAWQPWLESDKHRGPKALDWNNLTPEAVRSLRMVHDIPFGEVVRLIEKKYHVKIDELEGAKVLSQIREAVNAFKHRDGLVDFRKQELGKINFVEHHIADVEKAYEVLDQAFVFISALWKATGREPVSL